MLVLCSCQSSFVQPQPSSSVPVTRGELMRGPVTRVTRHDTMSPLIILGVILVTSDCVPSDVTVVTESPSVGLIKPHKDLSIWIADDQVKFLCT